MKTPEIQYNQVMCFFPDLRNLPDGAFLLKVLYGDQVQVRKVIVNR